MSRENFSSKERSVSVFKVDFLILKSGWIECAPLDMHTSTTDPGIHKIKVIFFNVFYEVIVA